MKKKDMYIGLDVGGSSIKYGIGDGCNPLEYFNILPLHNITTIDDFRQKLADIFEDIAMHNSMSRFQSIGIGTPGTIDLESQAIIGINPNLKFLSGYRYYDLIKDFCNLPTYVENDANLMVLAEAQQFPLKKIVLGITIGTGIGSGLIYNGSIYGGANGIAMELGHAVVIPNGAACNCGKNGCLEAYASVTGLRREIQQVGLNASQLNLGQIIKLSFINEQVKQIVINSIERLSEALSNAVILLNPDLLIIGGGASEIEDYPFDLLKEKIICKLHDIYMKDLTISKAILKNKAGVFGAILFAKSMFLHNKE